jgi:hypothetical protein
MNHNTWENDYTYHPTANEFEHQGAEGNENTFVNDWFSDNLV